MQRIVSNAIHRRARSISFERVIELEGDLTAKQKARLLEIADRCPVHRTLHQEVTIVTTLGTQ